MKMKLTADPYIHTTLMRDLVGHDHRPACFLVYLWLFMEQQQRGTPVAVSYAELATETGLSRSSAQSAVKWLIGRKLLHADQQTVTATPIYTALTPWQRRAKVSR